MAYEAQREQALRLVLTASRGQQNPFDITQESDKTRGSVRPRRMGAGVSRRPAAGRGRRRMVRVNLAVGTRTRTRFAI